MVEPNIGNQANDFILVMPGFFETMIRALQSKLTLIIWFEISLVENGLRMTGKDYKGFGQHRCN